MLLKTLSSRVGAILITLFGLTFGTLSASNAAEKQSFPWKPVRLIVTSPAGNVTDLNARLIGSKLTQIWGQPVIVEQKVGANGVIGAQYVVNAEPDGHTLLLTTTGLVQTWALGTKMPYDIFKDLAPISQVFILRLGLVVTDKLNVTTLGSFIDLARQNPSKYKFGSFGVGSTAHMVVAKLNHDQNLEILHVPYKGTTDSLRAVVAGEVDAALLDPFIAKPYIEAGRLQILATTGGKRSAYSPNTPTFTEVGIDGFGVDNWAGWFAPAGVPKEILVKISEDIKHVQSMPDVIADYERTGIEIANTTPDQFSAIVQRDAEYWRDLVASADVKID